MCGVLGVLGETDSIAPEVFARALDTIAHRGPDAQGIWRNTAACLGHRRLAIIDLSAAGAQPMVDPDTGLVIVFNGEIYNYVELRAELSAKGHRFRTGSDTEVLLKGYAEWGAGVLERCNGMWGLAIWDPAKQQGFLARDRFGKKPLYYARQENRMLFASEPKALHALDVALTEPDPSAVVDLVVNSRLHAGERTCYRLISALPAAHYAIFDVREKRFSLKRYWDYPEPDKRPAMKGHHEHFAELMSDAVRLRFRSDVPVGLTLSGGLDSSAILAARNNESPAPIRCYTSVYSSAHRGEEPWAQIAARLGGTTAIPVEASMSEWWPTLRKIVHHMDGPGAAPAVLPLWAIMAQARRDGVPVLLEGQGADELLGGYTQYSAIQTLEHLKAGQFRQFMTASRQMRSSFTVKWTAAWMARHTFPRLAGKFTRDRRLPYFHPHVIRNWQERPVDKSLSTAGAAYDPLHQALWRDHAIDILPSLLHYGDLISMSHGIESRLPFMDYRIVEWVFRSQPPLLEGGETKSLVRTFLQQRQFDEIANRRDKQGYPTPVLEWYRTIGSAHLADMLADAGATIWGIMDRAEVKKLSQSSENGSMLGMYHLFKILTTGIWLNELNQRSACR